MDIQLRILKFVTRANWVLLFFAVTFSGVVAPVDVSLGILAGGLVVTGSFHLMYRNIKKSFTPPHTVSARSLFARHYLRFIASVAVIYILVSKNIVDPGGLLIGLSVVFLSIVIASVCELKKMICKEAV